MTIDSNYMPTNPVKYVGIDEIIGQQMQAYALLMFILSFAILFYVLWNNFVRSPSKKANVKDVLNPENQVKGLFEQDIGVEPSMRVKKISRALDEYLIIPALVMFYISLSYYISIRG